MFNFIKDMSLFKKSNKKIVNDAVNDECMLDKEKAGKKKTNKQNTAKSKQKKTTTPAKQSKVKPVATKTLAKTKSKSAKDTKNTKTKSIKSSSANTGKNNSKDTSKSTADKIKTTKNTRKKQDKPKSSTVRRITRTTVNRFVEDQIPKPKSTGKIIQINRTRPYSIDDEDEHAHSPDPTDLYLKEISAANLLTKEEEIKYARLVQKGDLAAKNRMIASNLRLVVKIARRYIRSGMPILDLIEEGNLGLIRAVEKFDPEKGFRFSTYGAWWIQQAIERAIMGQNRTVRLPVHVVKRLNSFLRKTKDITKDLHHEPTTNDLSSKMNESFNYIEQMLTLNEKVSSLDAPISGDIDKPILETMGDSDVDPIHLAAYLDLKSNLNKWLDNLPETEKSILEHRFGLNSCEPRTLEETGVAVGLTRERVRQLQTEALRKLKQHINSAGEDFNNLVE